MTTTKCVWKKLLVATTALLVIVGSGCSDKASDGGDEGNATDTGLQADAHIGDGESNDTGSAAPTDTQNSSDTASTSDSGPAADAGAVVDSGSVADAGPVADAFASDSGSVPDSESAADAGSPLDAGIDSGASADASSVPDAASSATIAEQAGPWPSKAVRLSDDGVWLPIRTIPDGKGGTLKLRAPPPLIKPEKTRYSPVTHEPGALSLIFREGYGVVRVGDRVQAKSPTDNKPLAAVYAAYGHLLGPISPLFPGSKAKLDAERVQLEQKTGRALRDRTLMFMLPVHEGADLAEIADAFNDAPVVELAAPLFRPKRANPAKANPAKVGRSKAHDKGSKTLDFTPWQRHLLGSPTAANSDGGHGITYAWSLPGGRGENTQSGMIEEDWNRTHEDFDWNTITLMSTFGGKTTSDIYGSNNHDMSVLGIYKARNDAIGVTGICSESAFFTMPYDDVDKMKDWVGRWDAWRNRNNSTYNFANVLMVMSKQMASGSFVSASLGWGGPNEAECTAQRECSPRVQCLPAAPYEVDPGGKTRMRCEGYPFLNAASNGCATDADCRTKHGYNFGARCLPVPKAVAGFFGTKPAKWRCGGDPDADTCTTSNDCERVGVCKKNLLGLNGRCGDFKKPFGAAKPAWVTDSTFAAGGKCSAHSQCAMPTNTPNCTHSICGDLDPPLEFHPEIHTAIAYAAARGVTLLQAASNEEQRLGLLHDDNYPQGAAVAGQKPLLGNDLYKRMYSCPFPGCQPRSGGWVVGAADGWTGQPLSDSSRGGRVDVAGWGDYVATTGYGDLHMDKISDTRATNTYTSDFSHTSCATPMVGAMATSLQGIVFAHKKKLLPAATVLSALQSGVPLTVANPLDRVGNRVLMQKAIKWLTTHGENGGPGSVLPPVFANLSPPKLEIAELGAVRTSIKGGLSKIAVAIRITNKGAQTSPPVGLRVTFGKKTLAVMDSPTKDKKKKSPAGEKTLAWSCVREDDGQADPKGCCGHFPGGKWAAVEGCRAIDHAGRHIFAPMIDGTQVEKDGGSVPLYYELTLTTVDYLSMGGEKPRICVMLDREATKYTRSRLDPWADKPPKIGKCVPVGVPPKAIAISSTFGGKQKLRPYAFEKSLSAEVCGATLVGNEKGVGMWDIAATTRNRLLFFSAFPHSGTVGVYDAAACDEIDFDEDEDTPSCGAPGTVNRLDFTGQTPGLTNACSELGKKQGRNPMALAVSRDQRFIAVALGNINNSAATKCTPGKLAFIDLRDPAMPKILQEDDGAGGKKNVEIPIGPRPKAVAISHEGQKDARIVVIHDTNSTDCKKAPHASVITFADVITSGSKAKVTTRPFLYKCSGGWCGPRLPHAVMIDKDNLAAFVTFKQAGTGSSNTKNTGSIGVLRLSDLKTNVLFRKQPHEMSWDRPYGLDTVNLGGTKVRVAFVGTTFHGMKKDYSGNACKPGYSCGGIHWHDVDVAALTGKHVNAGRLIPNMTVPRDIVISDDTKFAIVVADNVRVARFELGAWTNIKLLENSVMQGGKRIVRLPKADDFCPDERCDGVDNDCDGDTDEDWPDKDKTCHVGTGACSATGKFVCTDDEQDLRCDKKPGKPNTETCNGVDDDCDGTIDELWRDRLGRPCSAGLGQCKRFGAIVCDGAGVKCPALPGKPSKETCNGLDDDCDGKTDEDGACPKPDPCKGVSCGNGACNHAGGQPFCVCHGGYTAVGLTCVKNPTCNIALPNPGACPAACTGGCMGPACIIACNGKDACKAQGLTCPKDRDCRIDCIGDGACSGATVTCGDGLLCDLRCQGIGACGGATLTCGAGMCQSACWGGAGKLSNTTCGSACSCLQGCK